MAEGEILAGHDARVREIGVQPLGDERLRRQRGERRVEREDDHRIDPGRGEQPFALVERGQPERRRIGAEVAHRMRIEGRDDRRHAARLRQPQCPIDDRLMAEVEAVEIAQRDHRARQVGGQGPAALDPPRDTRHDVSGRYRLR